MYTATNLAHKNMATFELDRESYLCVISCTKIYQFLCVYILPDVSYLGRIVNQRYGPFAHVLSSETYGTALSCRALKLTKRFSRDIFRRGHFPLTAPSYIMPTSIYWFVLGRL